MGYPAFDMKLSAARQEAHNNQIRQQQEAWFAQKYQAGPAWSAQGSDPLQSAYRGYSQSQQPKALPSNHWTNVLGVKVNATVREIKAAYRALAKVAHADTGGSDEAMARLNAARDQAMKELGR